MTQNNNKISFITEVVAATSNRHKFEELRIVTQPYGIQLLSPAYVAKKKGLDPIGDILENGATYRENALIKAQAYMQWSGMAALGDDSGLEIPVLNNKPGIYSARYGGDGLNDSQRISLLIKEVTDAWGENKTKDNRAVFRCSLAYAKIDGSVQYADSELWGTILTECRGTHGFGYDPIILIDNLGKTLAEVDFSVTCKHGFRAKAARELLQTP